MKKTHLLVGLLLTFFAVDTWGQSFYSVRHDRSVLLIAGINTATYYGDLKDNKDILDVKPSLTLGLMYFPTKRLGIRGEFSWVTLSGSDANSDNEGRVNRNLSFTSSNYDFNISAVVNLFQQGGRFYQRPVFNVYGIVGIGGLYFNPKAKLNGETYALAPLHTEGVSYSRFTPIIPFGAGVKIKVTPFFNLALEAAWRKTFTDYIDDVSSKYIDNASFTDPIAKQLADRRPEIGLPTFKAGTKRGDATHKDAYMLFSARLEYYLSYSFNKNGQRKLYNKKRRSVYHR